MTTETRTRTVSIKKGDTWIVVATIEAYNNEEAFFMLKPEHVEEHGHTTWQDIYTSSKVDATLKIESGPWTHYYMQAIDTGLATTTYTIS